MMETQPSSAAPLDGLSAIVTGGNSGIGLGIAKALAGAGAHVAIWGTNHGKNVAAADELSAFGTRVHAEQCDVADEASVEGAFDRSVRALGTVDCVVANAGVMAQPSDPWLVSFEDWQRVLAVNLNGTFLTFRAAARHLVQRGRGGSLIAVGSIVGDYGAPSQLAYAASKSGILATVRGLAVALARYEVRVNALLPGWTDTGLLAGSMENARFVEQTVARTPLRRHATPDDYAAAAVFLADPRHVFHTGTAMVVDGGYTIY